jgi:hypothetical protein
VDASALGAFGRNPRHVQGRHPDQRQAVGQDAEGPRRPLGPEKARQAEGPLGIPTWSDKLVQEVLRTLLEPYYEQRFSDHSHGFRPNRGCHTALREIQKKWTGTVWFIEGDIKGCFDNIDHAVLLDIIRRDIHDGRLMKCLKGRPSLTVYSSCRQGRTRCTSAGIITIVMLQKTGRSVPPFSGHPFTITGSTSTRAKLLAKAPKAPPPQYRNQHPPPPGSGPSFTTDFLAECVHSPITSEDCADRAGATRIYEGETDEF